MCPPPAPPSEPVSVQDLWGIPWGRGCSISVETLSISHETGFSIFCQDLD